MKTNKENGFYWVEYRCMNCGTVMSVKIPYGESMPIYSDDEYSIKMGYVKSAPECTYCGRRDWSHGKKPS